MRKHMLAVPVLIAVLAGWAVGVTAQDEAGPDGLVTEEVEPGVERIIRDDAGHDLDETHPTYRLDMDRVAIMGDGSVLLLSSYRDSDNSANPPGPLLWVLGEPDPASVPDDLVWCDTDGMGVFCFDLSGHRYIYLEDTPINQVAVASDGTIWAVGGYDGGSGGLYRITRD
ncbi:MAG: hypothetical protein H0U86_02775 [Chloroflexi bacterium]|nr:hypothetical protein [Chloroflexota bacterium]